MIRAISELNIPEIQTNQPIQSNPTPTTSLDHQIQTCLEHARRITQMMGHHASESVIAWDVVEELLAYKADQRQRSSPSPFELYCAQYPEAPECRIYDL